MRLAPFLIFDDLRCTWRVDAAPDRQLDISDILIAWVRQYSRLPASMSLADFVGVYKLSHNRDDNSNQDTNLPLADDTTPISNKIKDAVQLTLTLSMDKMRELDDLLATESIPTQYDIIDQIMSELDLPFIDGSKHHSIGIDFTEVFLVEAGQDLPYNYRPDVDRVVHSFLEFKQHSARFSYQFAKVFLGKKSQAIRPISPIIDYIYPGWWSPNQPNSLNFNTDWWQSKDPDNWSTSHLTHVLELKSFLTTKTHHMQMIVRLGPQFNLIDLQYCQSAFKDCSRLREIIFLLSDPHYREPENRAQVLQTFLDLAVQSDWQFFPHVFLLTRPCKLEQIHKLETDMLDLSGFHALKSRSGFYLSAPDLFARIYRNLQTQSQVMSRQLDGFGGQFQRSNQKKSSYIIGNGHPSPHYRKFKTFDISQLKAQISISATQQITQSRVLTENQTLQQEQELSQQQSLSQTQAVQQQQYTGFNFFGDKVTFSSFCHALSQRSYHHSFHPELITQSLRDNHYYTEYHAQTDFMLRLSNSGAFCKKVTASVFGRFDHNTPFCGLAKHSFTFMKPSTAAYLLDNISLIIDGLDAESLVCEEQMFFQFLPAGYSANKLIGYSGDFYQSSQSLIPHLSMLYTAAPQSFQPTIQASALLREEDYSSLNLSEQGRVTLTHAVQALATVFQAPNPEHLYNQLLFRRYVMMLFRVHCSKIDLAILTKFLNLFEDFKQDYTKIILYPIVVGYRDHAERFLDLLHELDKRALMNNFYKMYFVYATKFDVLVDVLSNNSIGWLIRRQSCTVINSLIESFRLNHTKDIAVPQDLFLSVASQTPVGDDPQNWPLFEKFAHHFLLYASKHNINIKHIDLSILEKFWQNINAKIKKYHSGDKQAVNQAIDLFVNQLICSQRGLVIAPVSQAMTVLNGLEKMIQNAIQHDMLAEQCREWEDLSLCRTDAVYAGIHDGFGVVTKEMAIEIMKLRLFCQPGDYFHMADSYLSSYRFSAQNLKIVLNEQCMVQSGKYDTLYTKIFRYLGCQTLREPVAFYRQLHAFQSQQSSSEYVYFRHMLLGYFVLAYTGAHYTQTVDSKKLYRDFVDYLLGKNYVLPNNDFLSKSIHARVEDPSHIMRAKIKDEFSQIIVSCVQDFCDGLESLLVKDQVEKAYSLWFFYDQFRAESPGLQQGLSAWFGLDLNPTFETIPEVFKKKFSLQHLGRFFLVHQEELKKSSIIFRDYPHILDNILRVKIEENFASTRHSLASSVETETYEAQIFLFTWFKSALVGLEITEFIHHVADCDRMIAAYSDLVLADDYQQWSAPLKALLSAHCQQLKTGLQILSMIVQQRNSEQYQALGMARFIEDLLQVSDLVASEQHFQAFAPILSHAYMVNSKPDYPTDFLIIGQKLIELEVFEAVIIIKTLVSHSARLEEGDAGFLVQLSARSLQGLANVLVYKAVDLKVLEILWQEEPYTDFSEASALFKSCDLEQSAALSQVSLLIYQPDSALTMSQILSLYSEHPKSALSLLARLITLYAINADRIRAILAQPNLNQAIHSLEQDLYAHNAVRFVYEPQVIAQTIAKIRKKSMDEKEDASLSLAEQAKILSDYERMMSYLTINPVVISDNEQGEQLQLPISQLDETQVKTLFQLLCTALREPKHSLEKKHAYRLMLLALSCEAHYRTTKKFPQPTQILCELHGLDNPDCIIQEVKTGGGKSIISQIRAVMLAAEGWTVDMATENNALAATALNKFKLFYDYLGVLYAKDIILPNSSRSIYISGGIHHSTPANFSFFRANMALKKKILPTRVALLCDEIDAALTTTLQYRLAGVLDPIYSDLISWAEVLSALSNFVRDEALFTNNTCDEQDDVHNFKQYFALHYDNPQRIKFVAQISEKTLNKLLNSALVAASIEENVDYLPIIRRDRKKIDQYAAPILNVGTKRPEPSVSYSEGVQQLLHIMLNEQNKKGMPAYSLDAMTETIMILSAKNFFDGYPLVIGWTGTPGSKIELQEFYQENRLQAYYYPVFHPDLSEDLGMCMVESRLAQHASVLETIVQERLSKPEQPMLVVADSPKAVAELKRHIQIHAPDLDIQTYTGYEDGTCLEADIVERAGQHNKVTVCTLSLTRGTDFESSYPHGICEINTAVDISESERVQLEGRVARNGKLGQFRHIICTEDLDSGTAIANASQEQRFLAQQRVIGERRQAERLKTRFLELMRHHIVKNYFLAMRSTADQILVQQEGVLAKLIEEKPFLEALRDFTEQSEQVYMTLLGADKSLDSGQQAEFMQQLIRLYQTALDNLIPDQRLQNFQVIEPLIALESWLDEPLLLPAETELKNLHILSSILSAGWRAAGNQFMVECLQSTQQVIDEFQPYFNDECSLRVASAELMERRNILKTPVIVSQIDHLKTIVAEFSWQDAISNVQHGMEQQSNNRVYQAISTIISQVFTADIIQDCKQFTLDYLEQTQTQIAEKRWDDLALPDFNIPWIQTWLNRINMIFTTVGYMTFGAAFVGGPITFLITRFGLPVVLSWIKTLIKQWFADSESMMVQILMGLDDAVMDLTRLAKLLSQKELKSLTIDEILNDVAPLFHNKAIQLLCNKILASPEMGNRFFQLLPHLFTTLEPYRHLVTAELGKPEIILSIFLKILQSDLLKQMMDPEEHAHIVEQIKFLPSEFADTLKDCTVPQLFNIFRVLAHPKFNECLNQLPAESNVADLVLWLRSDLNDLPLAVQSPIIALHAYQTDHQRIAQETQLAYRNIKTKFALNIEDLQTYAINLQPKPMMEPRAKSEPVLWQILTSQLTYLILKYMVLVLVNYLLFHCSLLWVTGAFLLLFVAPDMYQMCKDGNKVVERVEDPLPPFHLGVRGVSNLDEINLEPETPVPNQEPSLVSSFPAYQIAGLFRQDFQHRTPIIGSNTQVTY